MMAAAPTAAASPEDSGSASESTSQSSDSGASQGTEPAGDPSQSSAVTADHDDADATSPADDSAGDGETNSDDDELSDLAEVADELEAEVADELDGQAGDELEAEVGDELDGQVEGELEAEVGDELDGQAGDELDAEPGDESGPAAADEDGADAVDAGVLEDDDAGVQATEDSDPGAGPITVASSTSRTADTLSAAATEVVEVSAAAATTEATASEVETAATATIIEQPRVTVGSMIIDFLYSIGIRNTGLGDDFLAIPVPNFIESWWRDVRTRIYPDGDGAIPDPGPDPEPEPDPGPGELLWETNFTDMDEALRYWGLQTGRWGGSAGENQYYTDGDNVYIDADGNLVIEARRETPPDGLGAPYNYTSARVVTYGKQSFGVGNRVVARIQMPVDQGTLPAFWSVGLEPGHEFDWPRQGEIDIVEVPGFGTPESATTWTGNIHGPAATNKYVDVKLHDVDADIGVDLSQDFHEYGIDWYPDRIVWHVDGVEVGQVTKARYQAFGGDWKPFSGAWDHYLILNVAVGNPWTGDPDSRAPYEAQMKVDWVKVYEL